MTDDYVDRSHGGGYYPSPSYPASCMSSSDSRVGGECGADQWVKNTRLFRQWEVMKHEIQLHKWYESEKAGHDIGWERATVDWMIRFGNKRSDDSAS